MTFEDRVRRLEEIVAGLEREDLPLDEALRLFEEGVECLREASTQLHAVEAQVQRLVERGDGSFDLSDLRS
jgi:exodeoxyribonuclease VII small subunit